MLGNIGWIVVAVKMKMMRTSGRSFKGSLKILSNPSQVLSLESSPRMCRSQTDHSVAGRIGSVHPIGHPMIQSEKFGLKIRAPGEDLGPASNFKWSGCEKGKRAIPVGAAFQLLVRNHIIVQRRAALPSAIWLPVWVGSFRNFIPSLESSSSIRLQ